MAGVVVLAAASSVGTAQEPTAAPQSKDAEKLSPLERLKLRSPLKRWQTDSRQLRLLPAKEPAIQAVPQDTRPAVKVLKARSSQNAGRVQLQRVALQDTFSLSISQEDEAKEKPKSSPLKKITEILPYADYLPKIGDDRTKPGTGDLKAPQEVQLTDQPYEPRAFDETLFTWEASNLYYNPLYFQDVGLERYGHTHHDAVQPFASVGLFGVQLLGLPYQMTIDPICKRMYALGYYRPGECAPKKYYQIPFNLDAALVEGGVLTGAIFLFP